MSTRERGNIAVSILAALALCCAVLLFMPASRAPDHYMEQQTEPFAGLSAGQWRRSLAYVADNTGPRNAWALKKNTTGAGQSLCAHVLSTSGAPITSGSVNVYYLADNSTNTYTLDGTAEFKSNGSSWCRSLSAAATNGEHISYAFIPTAAGSVPSHVQLYTTGYDQSTFYANGTVAAGSVATGVSLATNSTVHSVGSVIGNVGGNLNGTAAYVTNVGTVNNGTIAYVSGNVNGSVNYANVVRNGTIALVTGNVNGTVNYVTTTGTTTAVTQERGKYANGAVWVNTVSGSAGSSQYTHGIITNPSNNLVNAKVLADALILKRFWIQAGSSDTLGQAYVGYVFDGRGYSLNLGGRDISGSQFLNAEGLTGTGSCPTAEAVVINSHLTGSLNIGEADFQLSHLNGTVTQSQASVPYLYHACVGVGSSARINFSAANQSAVIGKWSGDLVVGGMTSTNTLWMDGAGGLTLDNTNANGTVYVSGPIRLTNNGSAMTIYDTTRYAEDQNVTHVTGSVYHLSGSAQSEIEQYLGSTHGTGSWDATAAGTTPPTAGEIADAVWDEGWAAHTNDTTTGGRLSHLDATISTRAAASSALDSATWTNTRAGYLDRLNTHLDTTVSTRSTYDHVNDTVQVGHLTGTALTEIEQTLATTHGTGSWDATAAGSPAPTVDEISDEIDSRHGTGPYTK